MKRQHSGLATLVLLILCTVWAGCGGSPTDADSDVDNTNFTAKEPFYRSVGLEEQYRLSLEGVSGNISVTGLTGADSVIVSGEKRVRSESVEDAQEHLELLEVDVQDLVNDVTVKTQQPDKTHGRVYEVDYEITLPRDFIVQIVNVNGNVNAESIVSPVAVENTNGWVVLDGIAGSTTIVVTNGVIGGDVTLPLDGTIDMAVTNGSIDLQIPVDTSAQFSASVTNGNITDANLVFEDRLSTATSLTGRLGNGRGTIQLTVVNGNIAIAGF